VRLLVHEARGDESPAALAEAAERVCLRLRNHAGKVLGVDAFDSLFARALALVKPDLPFLEAVTAEPPLACLKGLRESLQEQAPQAEATDAIVAVVATFLALLASLVGEELSLSVLVEVWAERSLADGS